jgi:hypothetical protein
VIPIGIVGLAQFRCADDLRGDVVAHYVQVHVALKSPQLMFDE